MQQSALFHQKIGTAHLKFGEKIRIGQVRTRQIFKHGSECISWE
jgi:hypothetical protein